MQIAIFVDAGYFFAQGSAAIAGQKQGRNATFIRVDQVLESLRQVAELCAPSARLLRTYWYDGVLNGRLSSTQEQLAGAPKCKLRLGLVNSVGEQKGVDSLIVTDSIELARNGAISDAVLLAGDEDLRIGVQIAQSFGVQVHLLGIKPARGSQSTELIREADTHHEWDATVIGSFMNVEPSEPVAGQLSSSETTTPIRKPEEDGVFAGAVQSAFDGLSDLQRESVLAAFKSNPSSVPPDLDRTMLPKAGAILERMLSDPEKRALRKKCQEFLQRQISNANGD